MRIFPIYVLTIAFFVSGCATTPPIQYGYPGDFLGVIQIDASEPADIEVNNSFLGTTPITYLVIAQRNPNFMTYDGIALNKYYMGSYLNFVATPKKAGKYVQKKYVSIDPYNLQTMPKKMFFHMDLEPAQKEYNVNINQS